MIVDDAVINDADTLDEALAMLDKAIREISSREIVSTSEMIDLLLDVRRLVVVSKN